MTPAEIEENRAKASPDLRFLLDREGVSLIIQARLVHAGVTTMRQFGACFTTSEDLRSVAKVDFALDPTVMAQRVELSKLVVAWESAKIRSTKLTEAEADAEVRQEAKLLKGTDVNTIRKSYESKWWKLEEDQVPAKVYLERLSEGIEKGELRAELLSEAVNKLEGETDLLRAVWDPNGTIKAVRTTPTVPLPRDPEEFRSRMALVGRAWAFVALMQPNCSMLQGTSPQDWAKYMDHMLGPYVFRLHSRDEFGNISSSPSWSLILSYDQEIRRKMVKIMTDEGRSLSDSLKMAYMDPVVKERFFTTPLVLACTSRKRSAAALDSPPAGGSSGDGGNAVHAYARGRRAEGKKGKGKGKGAKGGKGGKGSNPSSKGGCARFSPDGKPICYAFNEKSNPCTRAKCPFLHVCGKCFADHPMYNCTA